MMRASSKEKLKVLRERRKVSKKGSKTSLDKVQRIDKPVRVKA